MKSFSNTYIFVFSIILVTLVATILSFIALQLKPIQTRNVEIEKMQSILLSVGIESTRSDAVEKYEKYVTESYVINLQGKKVEGVDAFSVDLKKQQHFIEKIKNLEGRLAEKRVSPFKKFLAGFINFEEVDKSAVEQEIKTEETDRQLPVYVAKQDNGQSYYVFPLRGKGLWGPIWGYVALESDMNTIYGAVYDHKSETPGLGAEIKESKFEDLFKGKKIFDENNQFVSISVIKPGTAPTTAYNIDAISGGTITSKGLEAMVYDCLRGYATFMEQKRN